MKSGHAVELSTVFNHPEETLVTDLKNKNLMIFDEFNIQNENSVLEENIFSY